MRLGIGSRKSPIRIQWLGKYKIIVLYFYINLMLRLQVQQLDGSFSRYAVTFWGYVGRFSRLKTNGVGTINPNSDAAPVKTSTCTKFISKQQIWPFLRFRRYFLSIEMYSDMVGLNAGLEIRIQQPWKHKCRPI